MQTQLKDNDGNAVANTEVTQGTNATEGTKTESPKETSPTGTSGGAAQAEPPDSKLPATAVPPVAGPESEQAKVQGPKSKV